MMPDLSFTPGFSPVLSLPIDSETVLTVSMVAVDLHSRVRRALRWRQKRKTVKTVQRFVSLFDTGLKPGVNEMSPFEAIVI
jgi:hypothetical protein